MPSKRLTQNFRDVIRTKMDANQALMKDMYDATIEHVAEASAYIAAQEAVIANLESALREAVKWCPECQGIPWNSNGPPKELRCRTCAAARELLEANHE